MNTESKGNSKKQNELPEVSEARQQLNPKVTILKEHTFECACSRMFVKTVSWAVAPSHWLLLTGESSGVINSKRWMIKKLSVVCLQMCGRKYRYYT